MKSPLILFSVGICLFLATATSAAQTLAVGNCRPHLTSYSTISAGVTAAPYGGTVLVCPGTYPEQVTITQSLTLRGVKGWGGNPVITVPSGGLVLNSDLEAVQLSVEGTDLPPIAVNISNLIVDGTDSAFNCSTGILAGIAYQFVSGSISNVEIRHQSPGGCGFGISLYGDDYIPSTVNIQNSNIHDFDNTGIFANSTGSVGFFVNLTSNLVTSRSPTVQAGVEYLFTDGLAARNTIAVSGQFGLLLDNFFSGMTAEKNTISGSNFGIASGLSEGLTPNTITGNILFNNGTGIAVSSEGTGAVVNSNAIVHSSIAAIDLDCSEQTTAERNTIFGAPVGIANVALGDTLTGNVFYSVTDKTTSCP